MKCVDYQAPTRLCLESETPASICQNLACGWTKDLPFNSSLAKEFVRYKETTPASKNRVKARTKVKAQEIPAVEVAMNVDSEGVMSSPLSDASEL